MSMINLIKNSLLIPKRLRSVLKHQERILSENMRLQDIQYRDMIDLISGRKKIRFNDCITIETEFPVAYDSPDHINPFGTIQDNTRNYSFYQKCHSIYGNDLNFLDLGCSGGGLVFEFALNGHIAIGLEGSDLSQKIGRANWRTIPQNLMTCDITKPFSLKNGTNIQKFEVISCWEVFEHIPEKDLAQLIENVKNHLAEGGIFVGSISKCPNDPLHVTLQENNWWIDTFKKNGLKMNIGYEDQFEFKDFCRGIEGGLFDSHNYRSSPEKGLHFIARNI